ncbi:unnamed protein product [Phyllotreta striolata]|uniref:Lysosomal Pro-X carboxypeptidase n=1 Tax=Phyllotreta striolata TaxID=444603 RepID=A0A9N9TUA7_PHYSR|nr:unnamed protein product [Phyllotreta striolata]
MMRLFNCFFKFHKFVVLALVLFILLKEAQLFEQKHSFETRYAEVPIDHLSFSDQLVTFKIRYLVSAKYHVKDGPIFVYLGHEGDITMYAENTGFLFDIAPTFNALLAFIEHRYYGQSLPFGNRTFASAENMKYLTTAQALEDFAMIIDGLKKEFFESVTTAESYPIIAFGASYGGMLSAWLRMKYPFSIIGAISSSAPLLYLPGIANCEVFYEIVTNVFEKFGREQCVKTIKLGWDVIINLTKTKLGMDFISSTWKLCRRIRSTEDVEKLLEWLTSVYVKLALSNYHYPTDLYTPLPAYPVKVFCDKLTSSFFNDTKGLIEQFSQALEIYTNYSGKSVCNNVNSSVEDFNEVAFGYQQCTDLVMPKCSTEIDMFITKPWDYDQFSMECMKKYGVKNFFPLSPLKAFDAKSLKYYSNILFTNGNMDPYSCCSISSNISSTISAYNIIDAPHHVDLRTADVADNNYIISTRRQIVETIKQWLNMI